MPPDVGFFLDLMNLISNGSLSVELNRDGKIASVEIKRNEINIDVNQPGMVYDIFYPLLVVEVDGEVVKAEKRGDRWKSNTMMIGHFLRLFEGIERVFVEKGKTLRIKYRGTPVVVIGPNEGSFLARMLGFHHLSIPHKVELITMLRKFWASKPS